MSGRLDMPKDKLIELAKQTLGVSPASHVAPPAGYLEELRKHVKFSKADTQFRIYPQPGYGYGVVRCLEKGCETVTIVLGERSMIVGGGQKEGIGSLSAYRVHVQDHPTHKANRFERVKAESKSQSSSWSNSTKSSPLPAQPATSSGPAIPSPKRARGSLLSAMDSFNQASASSPSAPIPKMAAFPIFKSEPSEFSTNLYDSASSFDADVVKARGFPAVKPEPYSSPFNSSVSSSSPMIPRKRYSMGDDTDITIPSSSPHRPSGVPTKKPKLESLKAESALVPLGTVDPNSPKPAGNNFGYSSTSFALHAARSLRAETNNAIDVANNLLAYYKRKSRKSPHDKKRIVELEKQLREHKTTKARSEVTLQATTDASASRDAAFPDMNQLMARDMMKQSGSQPVASSSRAHLPPILEPVASGSNVQLAAASSMSRDVPNAFADMDLYGLPAIGAMGGLPNYGDTMDYMSDDSSYGSRFRRQPAYRGPIADAGDIDKFLIEAGNAEAFDGNESIDKALAKLGIKKLGEQLPFMNISLMPHQVIGVAWMLEHERGNHKGGILADEMGLGKTIATMVQNRSDDPAVKSTLIIAPVALLYQWKLEIETKTEGGLKCLIYHGHNKPKTKMELQKYDVILTTFQTLALEWPDERVVEKKKKKQKKKKAQDSDDFIESDSGKEKKAKKKGLLLKMTWFRVVLDEAQNIRNRNTRISIAVTNLEAIYRWCLTGTPVTNALADCYAFLRFLEIRPWYDWSNFNSHIAKIEKKRPDLASSRLQAILNACLIRRKKDSVLDGKKLIELPLKEVSLRKLTFSEDERDIYNVIEKQSQAIINKYLRAGTILKNYGHVLVLLLRLRQLCSHPCLIQEGGDAFIRPGEDATVKHESQTELDRATILAGKEFVTKMKAKFKEVVLQRMAAERASAEAAIEEDECPICFDTLTKPLITRCGHAFCADCIDAVMNQPAVEDGNEPRYAMSERPCPTCREAIDKQKLFERSAFEPTDAELLDDSGESSLIVVDEDEGDGLPIAADLFPMTTKEKSSGKSKGKGKAKKRITKRILDEDSDSEDSENSDISDFIMESDEDEEEKDARRELKKNLGRKKRVILDSEEDIEMDDEDELPPPTVIAKKKGKKAQRFLPSTKMKEMMVLLKAWAEAEESKDEKTMVLSQWTSCLDLVANYLEESGFTFVRYQGNMTRLARDEAVRTFMAQGKARIMLMSLKCGGVGLNLTRANRVISLDLGWSPAVENQAFDRVHRLGQARPVTVERLVIGDTVEARILALQERKQNLADGSLGEGSGKKLGRLSVKDLANLFGLSVRGHEL